LPGQEPTILEQLLDLSTTIAEPVDNVNLTEEQEPLVVSLPEQEEEQQQPNDEKLTRRRRQRSSAKGE
jgi:hypothetical protein